MNSKLYCINPNTKEYEEVTTIYGIDIKEILDLIRDYKISKDLKFDKFGKLEEIERLKEKVKEWQDISTRINEDNNRLNNIINELEKDMREKYHKEIDYQTKIRESDLMQGDYPVKYYYAEQNEQLLNYYLNRLQDLKEGK